MPQVLVGPLSPFLSFFGLEPSQLGLPNVFLALYFSIGLFLGLKSRGFAPALLFSLRFRLGHGFSKLLLVELLFLLGVLLDLLDLLRS